MTLPSNRRAEWPEGIDLLENRSHVTTCPEMEEKPRFVCGDAELLAKLSVSFTLVRSVSGSRTVTENFLAASPDSPPVADTAKSTVYVTDPAPGLASLSPTVGVVIWPCAAMVYGGEVTCAVSEVVETFSVGEPAPGLVTPLAMTLTLWPAAIDLPANRSHVASWGVLELVKQKPIDAFGDAELVSKTCALIIVERSVPVG